MRQYEGSKYVQQKTIKKPKDHSCSRYAKVSKKLAFFTP